jgi:Bacterial regulatory helix-turn-helix protein, lysR family
MELRHLRYFVAVAEAGSLTVAAEEKLHTSQPSLSRQIRDLEHEVGAPLLTRRARGIVASYDKTALIGSGKLTSTNGYYGLRFAHNTDVFVRSFGHVNEVNAAGK